MKELLEPYRDREIGVNLARPLHIDGVTLVGVSSEYFTVREDGSDTLHHVPYHSVLRVAENAGGVTVGGLFTHRKHYPLVIKIAHVRDDLPT